MLHRVDIVVGVGMRRLRVEGVMEKMEIEDDRLVRAFLYLLAGRIPMKT